MKVAAIRLIDIMWTCAFMLQPAVDFTAVYCAHVAGVAGSRIYNYHFYPVYYKLLRFVMWHSEYWHYSPKTMKPHHFRIVIVTFSLFTIMTRGVNVYKFMVEVDTSISMDTVQLLHTLHVLDQIQCAGELHDNRFYFFSWIIPRDFQCFPWSHVLRQRGSWNVWCKYIMWDM